jgi:hypothetical protein
VSDSSPRYSGMTRYSRKVSKTNWEDEPELGIVLEMDFWLELFFYRDQCDQIGRFSIVFFVQFFSKLQKQPKINCATFSTVNPKHQLWQTWIGLPFGRIFHKLLWSPCQWYYSPYFGYRIQHDEYYELLSSSSRPTIRTPKPIPNSA